MAIFCGIVQFFTIIFFFSSETATAQPFPYFIFLHIVACFLFFFISQSNFWGFFRAIKSFWLLLFFIDGKLVWNHSSRVHFFWLPKSQRTYIFLSFLVVFSTIFNSCMHMLAKILKSQNFVFYFIFFAVFVQIKGK